MSGFTRILTNLSNDASAQPSLIAELWAYITETYFTIDISQYRNLGIELGNNGVINLSWAIIGIFLGMIVAAILGVYEKKGLGEFVRKLIYEECYTPESAKTLYELGFHKNAAVRGALRSGSLSKIVICTQKKEYDDAVAQKRQNMSNMPRLTALHSAASLIRSIIRRTRSTSPRTILMQQTCAMTKRVRG